MFRERQELAAGPEGAQPRFSYPRNSPGYICGGFTSRVEYSRQETILLQVLRELHGRCCPSTVRIAAEGFHCGLLPRVRQCLPIVLRTWMVIRDADQTETAGKHKYTGSDANLNWLGPDGTDAATRADGGAVQRGH